MNALPPVEPSAAHRAAAKELRGMFVALTAEGFTEWQALVILGHMLASNRPEGT